MGRVEMGECRCHAQGVRHVAVIKIPGRFSLSDRIAVRSDS
jgi:hypothetical protein